jgi:hypothetical protein
MTRDTGIGGLAVDRARTERPFETAPTRAHSRTGWNHKVMSAYARRCQLQIGQVIDLSPGED